MDKTLACPRCSGLLRLDDDQQGAEDAGMAPRLVCYNGCASIELTPAGEPLVVQQPQGRNHPMEQQMRLMYQQGTSITKISKRFRVHVLAVSDIVGRSLPHGPGPPR